MKSYEANLKSQDGTDFFVRCWEPDSRIKAVVVLIHGLGEHTGRYEHVAQALTGAGYALCGMDLRGHGRSGGIRGHIPTLSTALQDIRELLIFVTKRYPELPHFLYGHSMGGLLTLAYTLQHKPALKGMIVTGPGLRSPLREQKGKVLLAKILGSLTPNTLLVSGLETGGLARDAQVIQAYTTDPLVHDRISLGLGKGLLKAADDVWEHAREFSLPLLLMHGTADRITYAHGSKDFAALATNNNRDITLKLWDGFYHELHNEHQKQDVFRFMIDWLDAHIQPAAS
ncbi:MAG TPA: lysophospholipase [Anaerolineales bacterium]|nr:lysophospholipase [Anaerolineales bacterium]